MKILGMTMTHGKRAAFMLGWQEMVYFEPPAPAKDRFVVLDVPGLEALVPARRSARGLDAPFFVAPDPEDEGETDEGSGDEEDDEEEEDEGDEDEDIDPLLPGDTSGLRRPLARYLAARAGGAGEAVAAEETPPAGKKKRQREVLEIPADLWRYAVLEDFLDSAGADQHRWFLTQHFAVSDFEAFLRRHEGEVTALLAGALAEAAGEPRLRALERVRRRIERLTGIAASLPGRVQQEILTTRERLDRALIREAKRESRKRTGAFALSVDEWLALIPRLKTDSVVAQAARFVARDLGNTATSAAEVLAALERLAKVKAVRNATDYDDGFWKPLHKFLRFDANVTGKTYDISEAREETVQMSWDLLKAKRVGTITPGRAALVLRNKKNYQVVAYVQGERKLKFRVQKAGGRLQKFGCTLKMPVEEDARRMEGFLLDVERIDALASVDPAAALESVPSVQALPSDHPVRRAADAAATDFRQARVLADLLIELHTGVDAEIIRRMARSKTRKNRR